MNWWLVLMIVGVLWLLLSMVGPALSDSLPSRCPRCGKSDEQIGVGLGAAEPQLRWYSKGATDKYTCRVCLTVFKNHPNGSFVEDR